MYEGLNDQHTLVVQGRLPSRPVRWLSRLLDMVGRVLAVRIDEGTRPSGTGDVLIGSLNNLYLPGAIIDFRFQEHLAMAANLSAETTPTAPRNGMLAGTLPESARLAAIFPCCDARGRSDQLVLIGRN